MSENSTPDPAVAIGEVAAGPHAGQILVVGGDLLPRWTDAMGLTPRQSPAIATGSGINFTSKISTESLDLDEIVRAVRDRLVAGLPQEVRAIADEAASVPGLDALSVAALADYLEEHRAPGLAGRVRRLAVQDGDLVVVRYRAGISVAHRDALNQASLTLEERIRATGRNVVVVVIPDDMSIQVARPGGAG